MNQMHEKVKNFYNNQAKANPDSAAVLAVANPIERIYREIEEWNHFKKIVPLQKNMNVLELGCGAGRWCFNIAPMVNRVYGVDISHEVISLADELKKEKGISNITFLEKNLLDFSSEEKFDLIYFSSVLLYIDDNDINLLIHHFSDMLTEEGYFIIRDTCMTKKRLFFEFPYGTDYGPCPVQYRLRDEYSHFFKETGFVLVYHKVSYNKIHPKCILKTKILKHFFEISSQKTLTLLHFLGQIGSVFTKIPTRLINQYSHEFQIYKKERKI
jgi:ubiquinone/menaquinone biosynthesis C-methylase UbiE